MQYRRKMCPIIRFGPRVFIDFLGGGNWSGDHTILGKGACFVRADDSGTSKIFDSGECANNSSLLLGHFVDRSSPFTVGRGDDAKKDGLRAHWFSMSAILLAVKDAVAGVR
jgi:hypothetical protein